MKSTCWQDISSASKNGGPILIGWHSKKKWVVRCAWWEPKFDYTYNPETEKHDDFGAWTDNAIEGFDYERTFKYKPTHWMPLPPPPNHAR